MGKPNGWDTMPQGVPADIHRIIFPLTPREFRGHDIDWDQVMKQFKPVSPLDDLATIIYTSGTTGMPKGVMHSFRTMATVGDLAGSLYATGPKDRMLSYFPLAPIRLCLPKQTPRSVHSGSAENGC